MKKLIVGVVAVLGFIGTANAQIDCRRGVDHKHPICYTGHNVHSNHHRPHHGHPVIIQRNNDWVAPVIGGVILGAVINEATRPRVIEQPVIVQSLPPQTICSGWREVLNYDGTITRERICRPND